MKAFHLVDLNTYLLTLSRGEYRIGDTDISVQQNRKVELDRVDNILLKSTKTVTTHYRSETGEELSVADYMSQWSILDEAYDNLYVGSWDSLESEFAMRKFKETWKPVQKTEEQLTPVIVDVEDIVKSRNVYIRHSWYLGHNTPQVYYYYRQDAMLALLEELMNELGQVRVKHYHGGQPEDGQWCADGLRFAKAFGGYICPTSLQNVDKTSNMRGSLADLEEQYEKDKNALDTAVRAAYNLKYGRAHVSLERFRDRFRKASALASKIDSKVKTHNEYWQLCRMLDNIVKELDEEIAGK